MHGLLPQCLTTPLQAQDWWQTSLWVAIFELHYYLLLLPEQVRQHDVMIKYKVLLVSAIVWFILNQTAHSPTLDPSVQHCMTRKVFLAHKRLGTLFTFIWLGSLMNIFDVHNEAGPAIESFAAVLACIAVFSCRNSQLLTSYYESFMCGQV